MNLIGVCFFEQIIKLRKFFQKTIFQEIAEIWKRFSRKFVGVVTVHEYFTGTLIKEGFPGKCVRQWGKFSLFLIQNKF